MTGLIKTVLSLQHKQIPPTLHFERPHPEIDFANSPFVVSTRLRDWSANGRVRRAGVNSLGVGGTNAHVIVEEAPLVEAAGTSRQWQLLLLSARSVAALDRMAERLADYVETHPEISLADVAYRSSWGDG